MTGSELRQRRMAARLSQIELSIALGMTRGSSACISAMEHGDRSISKNMAARIERALGAAKRGDAPPSEQAAALDPLPDANEWQRLADMRSALSAVALCDRSDATSVIVASLILAAARKYVAALESRCAS